MSNNHTINPVLLSSAGRMIFIVLENPGCTVLDLQTALNLTYRGAMYGLTILLNEGLVRQEDGGRGRGHKSHYFVV